MIEILKTFNTLFLHTAIYKAIIRHNFLIFFTTFLMAYD